MTESCWYETNLANLWRYARNRIKNLQDREADLTPLVRGYAVEENYAGGVAARKAITESK